MSTEVRRSIQKKIFYRHSNLKAECHLLPTFPAFPTLHQMNLNRKSFSADSFVTGSVLRYRSALSSLDQRCPPSRCSLRTEPLNCHASTLEQRFLKNSHRLQPRTRMIATYLTSVRWTWSYSLLRSSHIRWVSCSWAPASLKSLNTGIP